MIILKILYVAAIISFVHYLRHKKKYETNENIEFYTVSEAIDEMNQTKQQLAAIEEMITEIESCSPESRTKFFSCEWTNIIGEKFNYDLYIDGNEFVSAELLKIAYSERSELRSLLRQQIRNLNERCNENSNENFAILSGERVK